MHSRVNAAPEPTGASARDRRIEQRVQNPPIHLTAKPDGYYRRRKAYCLDFNHFGLAFVFAKPLAEGSNVVLSLGLDPERLRSGSTHLAGNSDYGQIDDLIAVVHNCRLIRGGYRCGVQFRLDSAEQVDRDTTRTRLLRFEAFARTCSTDPT